MKDLIAKLQSDACIAMGAIWLHIEAREKRIADLERALRSAHHLLANTEWLSKNNIQNLAGEEADAIAAVLGGIPSAPAVEQQRQPNELRAWLSKLEDEVMPQHSDAKRLFTRVRGYLQECGYLLAPQAADTDKVREDWRKFVDQWMGDWDVVIPTDGYEELLTAPFPAASMAAQAPVREVPEGWKLVPAKATEEWKDRLRDNGYCPATVIDDVLEAAPVANELPGMWEQADLAGGETDCMPLPAAPIQQEGV